MLVMISCNTGSEGSIKTIISGKFSQFPGKKVVLSEIDISNTLPIDTVVLSDEGEFRFRIHRDSAGMYLLKIDNRNYMTLVLDQEKKVEVYSDDAQIRPGYRVEGSEDSQALAEFERSLERNKGIIDSLILQYNQKQGSVNYSSASLQMDQIYQDVFSKQEELSRQFIDEHCSSLASLLVLNRRFGMRKILTEEKDGEYYLRVDSCLSEKYPGNKHVLEQKERIQNILRKKALREHKDRLLAVGNKIPDITLEDPRGRSVSLHSFSGSKVILYFWASWNKDSRRANMEMKRIYELYYPRGLKIYAISLESYPETWQAAIKADALPWTNVTDYLNIQSGSLSLYNVPRDLPYFYLLDENMDILMKGNSFPELLRQLEKHMGKAIK